MSDTDRRDMKLAIHAAEQAEKHANLANANPGNEQFHMDSIMSLLEDMAKGLGTSLDEVNRKYGNRARAQMGLPPDPNLDPDPEEIWRRENGR